MGARTAMGALGIGVALVAAGLLAWTLAGGAFPSLPDFSDEPEADAPRPPTPPAEESAPPPSEPVAEPPLPEPRPLAMWRFEPRADGRYYARIADATGEGRDGLLVGPVEPGEGVLGRAARFPGSGAGMGVLNGSRGLDLRENWTFAAWVRPDDAGIHWLVDRSAGFPGPRAYGVLLQDGALRYLHGEDSTPLLSTRPGLVPAGAWTHVVVTRDAGMGQVDLYVDGRLVLSTRYDGPPPSVPTGATWLARSPAQDEQSLRGAMDEAALWDAALGRDDVLRLALRPGR